MIAEICGVFVAILFLAFVVVRALSGKRAERADGANADPGETVPSNKAEEARPGARLRKRPNKVKRSG